MVPVGKEIFHNWAAVRAVTITPREAKPAQLQSRRRRTSRELYCTYYKRRQAKSFQLHLTPEGTSYKSLAIDTTKIRCHPFAHGTTLSF